MVRIEFSDQCIGVGAFDEGLPMSKFIHGLSWLAAIIAVLATVYWVMIVADGNYCWSAFAFAMMAIPLGGGMLLFGVAPSVVLYLRKKQRRDLISLSLAGCSFFAVLVEAILLNFVIRQRGE